MDASKSDGVGIKEQTGVSVMEGLTSSRERSSDVMIQGVHISLGRRAW